MMDPPDTGSVRITIDDEQRVSTAVVEATAMARDADLSDCPTLYDQVNPDALDNLFADRSDGKVMFEFADCQVIVIGDAAVTAHPC